MTKRQDPADLRVIFYKCSNCGDKKALVVLLDGYKGKAGLCPFCITAAASALLEKGFSEPIEREPKTP